MSMPEKDFQKIIWGFAKSRGWLVYHNPDSRFSPAGFPDLTMCHPKVGRVVFVELKSEKGRLRKMQGKWIEALQLSPCEAYVWRPSDLPEIRKILSCEIAAK